METHRERKNFAPLDRNKNACFEPSHKYAYRRHTETLWKQPKQQRTELKNNGPCHLSALSSVNTSRNAADIFFPFLSLSLSLSLSLFFFLFFFLFYTHTHTHTHTHNTHTTTSTHACPRPPLFHGSFSNFSLYQLEHCNQSSLHKN